MRRPPGQKKTFDEVDKKEGGVEGGDTPPFKRCPQEKNFSHISNFCTQKSDNKKRNTQSRLFFGGRGAGGKFKQSTHSTLGGEVYESATTVCNSCFSVGDIRL